MLDALCIPCYAFSYVGRVADESGQPISYATVYPISDPVEGTATNMEGIFTLNTYIGPSVPVVISFIGYEKVQLPLSTFAQGDTVTITLKEQPIALEEMVVDAKPAKQRNKRKRMAQLLHEVYNQAVIDFGSDPCKYHIVSDVRMDSEGEAWGIEQMIASVVLIPDGQRDGDDSTQFRGEYCKRYFKPAIRSKADTILSTDMMEKMDGKGHLRRAANAIDSGVVVHRTLFEVGNVRQVMEHHLDEIKHWSVSSESEGRTVLTLTEKTNLLGMFVYKLERHFIIDSETYSIVDFSQHLDIKVRIPFGYKLKPNELKLLNLLNMDDKQIERFRLRKADMKADVNIIFQQIDGHLYIKEKNLHADAVITGTQKMNIPVQGWATQRVTAVETKDVQPLKANEITHRVPRQIVEIY